MMAKLTAILELTKSGLHWVSSCPTHGKHLKDGTWKGKRSSVVRGEQLDFDGTRWITFRCTEKEGHLFNALKPKDAPKTAEQAEQLRLKLRLAQVDVNPDSQKVGVA
jgi:hypothetical protein